MLDDKFDGTDFLVLQGKVSPALFIVYPCLVFATILSVLVDDKPEYQYQLEGEVITDTQT